jgi:hypothetical protein
MSTTTMEAPSGASGGRAYFGAPELYLPAFGLNHCDLCAAEVPETELSRITLEPGETIVLPNKRKVWRAARVAYACRRHRGEDVVGAPVGAPRERTLAGTSRLRPQKECLFDDLSLRRGGRR